ncbi:hypothetical protein BD779DRAFT_1494680 [Infundibulicybe gibba]|nr:hypothetical protein BD779DRAFT_1494680 [Infundibulicybe gibba]
MCTCADARQSLYPSRLYIRTYQPLNHREIISPYMSVSSAQIFGGLEVGIVLAALSNGVLVLQVSRYFRKPSKDPLFMKLFVLFIWLATVADLFLGASVLYNLEVTNHGVPIPEIAFPMTFPATAGVAGLIHSSVQSIYTYRLYRLTDRWLLPFICWTLSAYVLGAGITFALAEAKQLSASVFISARWNWLFYSKFSVSAGVDILIAVSTCWCLIEGRDRCLKRTQRLVNRLMLRIVQTGIATSIVAVCVVVTFATCQPSTAWLGLYLPLTPLYPITLLAL